MLKVRMQKFGNVSILHLQGRIAIGETTVLRESVFSQLNSSAVVLDLARVNAIDASGLGVLLELREWTHLKGIEFRLVRVTKLVKQVFEITCLDSVFKIKEAGSNAKVWRQLTPQVAISHNKEHYNDNH